jgi:UDP-N-acetylglucosamine 2-epimerase (non-hydrolysing)
MRLIVVVGARPNFVKAGPLVATLTAAGHDVGIAHTGQHYDAVMSDVFFEDLDIPAPRWLLGVGSGTHAVQTGTAMMRLEELFETERPDAVVAVGDVNSTLAAALAAAKVRVPVIHLEAGLRSFDMSMPEEVNRLVTDQLSAMLLAPTRGACDNLAKEGVDATRVHFVGNIMAESLVRNVPRFAERGTCERFSLRPGEYAVATVHRPENTDDPAALIGLASALGAAPLPVVLPAHPRTRPLFTGADPGSNVVLTDPVGYLDMLSLIQDAAVAITDSGGVQEEACLLGTPCVTVRNNTERQVTIELGANRLARAERRAILEALEQALGAPRGWDVPERWDADVSARCAEALASGVVAPPGY